ncbi:MAG: hypothetical protein INR69_07210 [Mucilaginibacter polytrichastri]|nr:hypothetical protein [Mucilaginibacter polytrichastri]
MKKLSLVYFSLSVLLLFSACGKDDNGGNVTPDGPKEVVTVKGDITANTTWTADKSYLLNGFVFVKSGVTLTIEPGTVIKGDKVSNATLVITRGAKINATGTVEKPIVFTSNAAAGSRNAGDWGGLIILGKAPINIKGTGSTAAFNENKIEGGLNPTAGGNEFEYTWYGGTDAADNSGTLKYVRVEYPGVAYSVDNEINGITFGGVGAGTTIEHVEVYNSGDDSFEWFGGTVNAKYLLAVNGVDDDFDTDNGFAGKIQFGVAIRNANVADKSGSNGFESDNDAPGSANTPQTKAVFSNMTIVGPMATTSTQINSYFQNGAQIRRNSSQSIANSIFMGFPVGVYIDDTRGTATSANALSGSLVFANNIIAGCTTPFKKSTDAFDIAAFFTQNANISIATTAEAGLTDAYAAAPKLTLKAGAAALTGAAFNGVFADGFFSKVAYKGAFDGTTDWTSGWATYDPQNTAY